MSGIATMSYGITIIENAVLVHDFEVDETHSCPSIIEAMGYIRTKEEERNK